MLSEIIGHAKWVSVVVLMNVWLSIFSQDQAEVKLQQQQVNEPQITEAAASSLQPTITTEPIQQMDLQPPAPNEETMMKEEAPAEAIAAQAVTEKKVSYKYVPRLDHDLSKYTAVEVVATGYSPGKESTGKTPDHPAFGITFSGIRVLRDSNALSTIAADTRVFPLGTVLFVPGYGYGVVADTGSAIKGKKIDLFFDTKDQVYQEWGKKTVKVFVVKKGAGKMTDVIMNQLKEEIIAPRRATRAL